MAQKSVLQIIQVVLAELNFPQTTMVLSSTDQTVQKMLALVRATCDDLLREYDWQQLQVRYNFATSNGVDNYAFPADYERFINGTAFDLNNRWPLRGPKTASEWEYIKGTTITGAPFTQYRVFGNRFYVTPTPGPSPYTFAFEYISNSYVRDGSTNTLKSDFTQDSDVCLFDHRVVIYGVKLKFKSSISQDTSEALGDYVRALEFAKGTDTPAPRLMLGPVSGIRLISNSNYPEGSWS